MAIIMSDRDWIEYLRDARNGNFEEYYPADMAAFFRDHFGKHYTEIPRSRIDAVDWLGYGWPRLDSYGDLIGIGGTDETEHGYVDVVVEDENGGEWIVACESADDIPAGLAPTKEFLYNHDASDVSELF